MSLCIWWESSELNFIVQDNYLATGGSLPCELHWRAIPAPAGLAYALKDESLENFGAFIPTGSAIKNFYVYEKLILNIHTHTHARSLFI